MRKELVFDFSSYKEYLLARVGSRHQRTGVKSAMASALRCQATYVSQVLYGGAHFSLEQAEGLSRFFGHTPEEKSYFLLLVQHDRAGTKSLKEFFWEQITQAQNRRMVLTQRLGGENQLREEERSIYYSSWQYAAIHIALTIPELRSRESLAEFFRITQKRVGEILEFLTKVGLAKSDGKGLDVGTTHIRLGKDSHNIIKHHTNWRNRAIEALEREELADLHYSAVISLSRSDVTKIKDALLESIREHQLTVKDSREEELFCYNLDFFNLRR
jgi:uncharacterized protein (TIGR02147 family)